MSGQLVAGPDLQAEFTYRDGVGYVFIRALARMLGIEHTSIMRGGAIASAKLAKSLAAHGFLPGAISKWPADGIPDGACAVIAEYFANDARNTTEKARDFLKLTSAMGVRTWVREKCFGLEAERCRARLEGKPARHALVDELHVRGCDGPAIANITDNNNVIATGERAAQLKKRRPGLRTGRDGMTAEELEMTRALEAAERSQLRMHNASGANQCTAICSATAMSLQELFTMPLRLAGSGPTVSPQQVFRAGMDF